MKQPELGKKIAELRKAKGLTQEELAKMCNLNVRSLQRIESGEAMPRLYTLKMILNELNYPLEDFNKFGVEDQLSEDAVFQRNEEQHSFNSKLASFYHSLNGIEKLIIASLAVIILILIIWGFTGKKNEEIITKKNTVWTDDIQSPKEIKASDISGIWQLSREHVSEKELLDNKYKPRLYTTYKIIDRYGNFTNVIVNNRGTHITAAGTFSVTEQTYTEHVAKSFTSPEFTDTDNTMTYKVINKTYLMLSYATKSGIINEVWAKVQYGDPLK